MNWLRHRPDPGVCRCGHPTGTHEHWRPGSDCGACGLNACRRYRPARPADIAAAADVDRLIDAAWAHTRTGERVDGERAIATIATHGPHATWRLLAWCASAVLATTRDLDTLPVQPEWDDAGLWASTFVHAYSLGLTGQERALYERLGPVDQHERSVALLSMAVLACDARGVDR